MIYFKCDVGYVPEGTNEIPLKYDDVVWTDKNRYLGIPTNFKGAIGKWEGNAASFQSRMDDYFGTDFLEFWFVQYGNDAYRNSVINNGYVPWAGYMYPNLSNMMKNNTIPKIGSTIIYISSVGKALATGLGRKRMIFDSNKKEFNFVSGREQGSPFANQYIELLFLNGYTKGQNLARSHFYFLRQNVNANWDDRDGSIIDAGTNTDYNWLFATNPIPDLVIDNDPYQPGGGDDAGGSGEGGIGGSGNFDENSDPIEFPALPTISASDTGFISLFNPSSAELKNLANYMWGDLFDLSTWKKIFADPMDAILGLSIVPVDVPNAGQGEIVVGNISTGISMTRAATQYIEVDCGTIDVKEYWGAYLDYAPYTKAELYLPYIGIHPVSIDDIMKEPVHIKYHVDILSGSCCAYVKCGNSIMYSFVGQCSSSIPITGNDWTNVINGALSIAASIGTMVATAQEATRPLATEARAVASGSSVASLAVNYCKPSIEKSGAMAGTGGMLGVQSPYLIITRPRQALPSLQNKFTGYPSIMTLELSTLSGYTEIEYIHLEGIPCTKDELLEIEELLKGGVIF